MKRTSTGEYGVINLEKLYDYKESFGFFANQLTYPEKLDFHPREFEGAFWESHPPTLMFSNIGRICMK